MCLITFRWQPNSQTPLILAANRDEFHARPAAVAQYWLEHPHVLAGKDLSAGGTWLGVTFDGAFAALTNVRQLPAPYEGQVSRGKLVLDYLAHNQDPQSYLQKIAQNPTLYDGFNLIVGNRTHCWYYSNRSQSAPVSLEPGLYGLSNNILDTPWPKLERAKNQLSNWMKQPSQPLHTILHERQTYPEHLQPNTGIGQPWETMLSAAFITSDEYGTRACTSLQIHHDQIEFTEESYDLQGKATEKVDFKI
ncbi:NRDE family protein [Oceaniserpentilla sp. 4NH20-0058]|uniref:NRDE family protein n=1 Tax=Oceaniserpentilla sp. 4NH20-0058 TaxID=3127660 RepID=UPI0031083C0C